MDQIIDFIKNLGKTSDWPARWNCGTWSDFHGWLYISSDLAIWMAYFAIPVILIWFIQRKPDVPFLPIFWLFGAFIILCGSTHLIDAIIFWWPNYRISALIRFVTAAVSWITVIVLIKDLPKALNLKSASALEAEIAKRKQSEEELLTLNQRLEKTISLMSDREHKIALMKEVIRMLKSGA